MVRDGSLSGPQVFGLQQHRKSKGGVLLPLFSRRNKMGDEKKETKVVEVVEQLNNYELTERLIAVEKKVGIKK